MNKEMIRLSPSKLGSFLECEACFWREYHKKMPPKFPLPGILNRMDSITKNYYDDYRGKLPPILKGKIEEAKLVTAKEAEILRKGILYQNHDLGVELKGKLDDCMIDENKKYIPIDNKTASPSGESLMKIYQMQLDCYSFLLNHNKYFSTDYGYLIYYTPASGDPEKGIVFNADVKKLTLNPKRIPKIIGDAVEVLRKPSAPKSCSKGECEMCDWIRQFK